MYQAIAPSYDATRNKSTQGRRSTEHEHVFSTTDHDHDHVCTNTTASSGFDRSSAVPAPARTKVNAICREGHHFDVLRIIKT